MLILKAHAIKKNNVHTFGAPRTHPHISQFALMLNCPFESFVWLDHYRAGSLCDDVKFGQRFVKRLFDAITISATCILK